ncbi:MAG: hypothetical protein K2I86_06555 [Prevotella sp.]|nr:hypothetical protein [Prevotella sp.]
MRRVLLLCAEATFILYGARSHDARRPFAPRAEPVRTMCGAGWHPLQAPSAPLAVLVGRK